MDGWTGVKLNAPAIVMGGGGHKKGHNLVKILLIISNFSKFHRIIIKTIHLREQMSFQPTIFHKLRAITP